jgi:hypothetical protein
VVTNKKAPWPSSFEGRYGGHLRMTVNKRMAENRRSEIQK